MDETTVLGRKLGDMQAMTCVDMKNRPVFLGIIRHLDPGESREVTLKRINPHAESIPPNGELPPKINLPQYKSGVVVHASVSYFNDDSTASLTRRGLQIQNFHLDETLKWGAVNYIQLPEM